MKGESILLDHIRGQKVAARMIDGKLDDLLVDAGADGPPQPGTIYRAKVDRLIKGQGGIFLALPDGAAFLRGAQGLTQGDSILVQVTGFAEAGKAVPVSNRLLFKSKYAIVTPGAAGINISRAIRDEEQRIRLRAAGEETDLPMEAGLILRSDAARAAPDELAEDIAAMADLAHALLADTEGSPECLLEGPDAHHLAWREWGQPDDIDTAQGCLETRGALDDIEAALDPLVSLGQAMMAIEPTRALVAVDVNTQGDLSPAAGLKANLATARDLPRHLRIRGLGGQITLDLAPLAKRDRRQFEQTLRAAFKVDPVETALVGWTPLGHFELQRKRERLPLSEVLK
ncbi:ribonuclease E/G [Actibacterium sp. 188UL27-1]|uniref:ribonuclease E/G n=1 Tax=Actibacterium sp. 188UL27-1 TaxID=2786961 RepID=UPI00195F206A|nr:ribonuclease E/G [Actibacterium sp. 188UL27-1]MBM7068798.1 ribonuclease E/G [Actibacterium sp. 188UL27-1]